MKQPDFLIIGAQKSGTTTLFSLLRKHPELYLPPQKEVQFFSNDELYQKGLNWYCSENFAGASSNAYAGEASPQYMLYDKVPRRIKESFPDVKLIAILRHPVKRAFSQYLMSRRRGQESRTFEDAFVSSISRHKKGEQVNESEAYYQHSNYSDSLEEYLKSFGRKNILVVFQEDLDKDPKSVLEKIYQFIGVGVVFPDEINVRLHQAGLVKYKWLNNILNEPSAWKSIFKNIFPWRFRQALKFWVEQRNINRKMTESLSHEVLSEYSWVLSEQKIFLEEKFGVSPPWDIQ